MKHIGQLKTRPASFFDWTVNSLTGVGHWILAVHRTVTIEQSTVSQLLRLAVSQRLQG